MGSVESIQIEQAIIDFTCKMNVPVKIEQCSNIDEMLRYKTDRLPIILLNEDLICFGRVPTEREILDSISKFKARQKLGFK